jgi:hypothetical protein
MNIQELPTEVLAYIHLFCLFDEILSNSALVHSSWNKLTNEDSFWYDLIRRDYGEIEKQEETWKQYYKLLTERHFAFVERHNQKQAFHIVLSEDMKTAKSIKSNMHKTIYVKKPLVVQKTPQRECYHFKIRKMSNLGAHVFFGVVIGRSVLANRVHRSFIGSQQHNFGLNDTGYAWRSKGYADRAVIDPKFFAQDKNGRLFSAGDEISVLVDVRPLRSTGDQQLGEMDLSFFKNGEYLCTPFIGVHFPARYKVFVGCSLYKVDDEISLLPSTRVLNREDLAQI